MRDNISMTSLDWWSDSILPIHCRILALVDNMHQIHGIFLGDRPCPSIDIAKLISRQRTQ